MPNYRDLGLQASVKDQNTKNIEVQGKHGATFPVVRVSLSRRDLKLTPPRLGPKVPNFKKPLPELRKEGLLGPQPSRQENRNHGSQGETLGREGN